VDPQPLESEAPPPARRLTKGWALAVAAWLAATAFAFAAIADYGSRPGLAARAPTSWPAASRLVRTPGRATLVMVAHTKCACTRASLRELERLMARAGDGTEAFVVFVGPREAKLTEVLDLRSMARDIRGVRVVEDEGEAEARIFAAATSGQVMLYDAHGALVFHGGLTASRGHEGESAGGAVVRRFVTRDDAGPSAAPPPASVVFGCALFDSNPHSDAGVHPAGAQKEP
jgi:hypothetical protein